MREIFRLPFEVVCTNYVAFEIQEKQRSFGAPAKGDAPKGGKRVTVCPAPPAPASQTSGGIRWLWHDNIGAS